MHPNNSANMELANLSLAEIASTLSFKEQQVLLASIQVAAKYIQQLHAEENQNDQNNSSNQNTSSNNQLNNINSTSLNLSNNNSINLSESLIQATNLSASTLSRHSRHDQQREQRELQQQLQREQQQQQQQQQQHLQNHNLNNNTNNHLHHRSSRPSSNNRLTPDSMTGGYDETTTDTETLLTIREFAEELKHRRKSIRLSQKGAAQSLRAFTNGDQPCTDAIIYHFENLQLEPERALSLIPLLSNWLDWAEKYRTEGQPLPMMSAVTKVPRERKRKVVLFNEKAKHYLEEAFVKNNHPDRYQLDVISQELDIPTRSIRKWFTNRRQRKRFAEKFSPCD